MYTIKRFENEIIESIKISDRLTYVTEAVGIRWAVIDSDGKVVRYNGVTEVYKQKFIAQKSADFHNSKK